MAHFLHPLRLPTNPEKLAFAHPREEGSLRPRLDAAGIDVGAHLTPKLPLLIGNLMTIPSDEFVVIERHKDAGKVIIRLVRDNRINVEATMEWSSARSLRVMLRDGRKHPSPNSGIPEAAYAGALGVVLGGSSSYGGVVVHKPHIGHETAGEGAAAAEGSYLNASRDAVALTKITSLLGICAAAVCAYLWSP